MNSRNWMRGVCLGIILILAMHPAFSIEKDTSLYNFWLQRGEAFSTRSNPQQDSALFYFRQIKTSYKPLTENNSDRVIWERYLTGWSKELRHLAYFQNKAQEVLPQVKTVLQLGKQHLGNSHSVTAFTQYLMGSIYFRNSDYRESKRHFRTLIKMSQGISDSTKAHNMEELGLDFLGRSHRYLGETDSAINCFNTLLQIEEERNVFNRTDPVLNELANIDLNRGNLDKALKTFQRILDRIFKEETPNLSNAAVIYNNMGIVYKRKGDYVKAADYFAKDFSIISKILPVTHPDLNISRMNQGVAYQQQGDYLKALLFFKKALDESKGTWFPGKTSLYRNLGQIYIRKNEFESALFHLRQGLVLAIEKFGPLHQKTISNYTVMGEVFLTEGKLDSSEFYCTKAFNASKKNPTLPINEIVSLYKSLGALKIEQKKYIEAETFLIQGIEKVEPNYGKSNPQTRSFYYQLAICYQMTGRCDSAFSYYEKALNNSSLPESSYQNQLEIIGYMQKHADAILSCGNSLDHRIRVDSIYQEAISLAEKIRSSYHHDDSQLLFQGHMASLFSDAAAHALLLARQTNDPAYVEKAFSYAEKGKAVLLSKALAESGARSFSGIPDPVIDAEKNFRLNLSFYEQEVFNEQEKTEDINSEKISSLRNKIFSIRSSYDSLLAVLEKEYPDYHKLKYTSASPDIAAIQKNLSSNSGFIEYAAGDSETVAFLILKDTVYTYILPPIESSAIDSLRSGLFGYYIDPEKNRKTQEKYDQKYRKYAYRLYQIFLAPFEKHLPPNLIIVPDGHLGYIPFEALLSQSTPQPQLVNSYPYLLKKYTISYAFSARHFIQIQGHSLTQKYSNSLLAMAPSFGSKSIEKKNKNPLFSLRRGTLSPLSFNQEEARSIAKQFGGKALVGDQAIKDNFLDKAKDYQVIHIATHAELNDQNSRYSFIAFTEIHDSLDNEMLYLADIYNLELQAELVVLSACNSGVGKLNRGEGIASLASGFASAGVKSLVTTLWSVNDHYTSDLMQRFYSNLKKGLQKDEALRKAKLSLLNDHNVPPFYWAAPIAVGNMAPLETGNFLQGWMWILALIILLGIAFLVFFTFRNPQSNHSLGHLD